MRINPALLKSVFFIGYLNHETNETIPVGTGVYLCNNDTTKAWIVTAAHVINELKKLGDINFHVKSAAYNHIENVHQILLLSIVDLIIGKSEYPPN